MEPTAKLYDPDYVIATTQGAIPYILETDKVFLRKPRLVYLDDFMYKGSYYEGGGVLPLKDFIASETEVYLATKGAPSILTSKRGNYRLSSDLYEEVSQRMEVKMKADYKTGIISINGRKLFQPSDLDEFNQLINQGAVFFSTEFVNKLTDAGNILLIKNGILCAGSILESENEYIKYMYSINEINAFTYMSESNYRVLHEYFELLKRKNKKAEIVQ
ncbi:hypothetical protein PAEPH01_0828 [Pancytospora epiphaga]|nr:hypothetical protein PAEPH01_0828 [Pancytospora epiphaga]